MGPPTTSGTRASYVEMVNEKGYCKKDKEVKAYLKSIGQKTKVCRAMRTDGAYIEAGEQDNLIVQKLKDDPTAYGIFGFSYLDQNTDILDGAIIDGTEPDFDNIAAGKYSVSCECCLHDSRSLCNEQKWSITINLANREKMGGIMTPHFYFAPLKNSIKSIT